MIRRFGPLIKTLRFESKNGYFKNAISISKNRKNICYSMAKRHQFLQYLHYSQDNYLEHRQPQGIRIQEVPCEELPTDQREEIMHKLQLADTDLIMKGSAVIFEGQRYSRNEAVVMGVDNDKYTFGWIKYIVLHEGNVYLLCELLENLHYKFHFNAYQVVATGKFELCSVSGILDYHPLGVYEINRNMFIPLKHYIRTDIDE